MPTHTRPPSEQGALVIPVPPQKEVHSHRPPRQSQRGRSQEHPHTGPPVIPGTGSQSHQSPPYTCPHPMPTPPGDAVPPLPSTEDPSSLEVPRSRSSSATCPGPPGPLTHRRPGPSGAGGSRGPGAAGTYSGPHHAGTHAGEHAPPTPPADRQRERLLVEIPPLRRRMVQPQEGGS